MNILTPIVSPAGYVDWVHPWRYADGTPVYLYSDDFGAQYCPVIFEHDNESPQP